LTSRKNYLMRNTALFAISSISTKAIGFLMVPFYTYVLTSQDYGTIDIIYTTTNILFPIVSISIYNAVLRYAMEQGSDRSQVFSNGALVTFLGILLTSIFTPLLRYSDLLGDYTWYIYSLIVIHCIYSLSSEFTRGIERIRSFVVGNIMLVLIIAITNLLFLGVFDMGIRGYISASVIGYTVATIYLTLSVKTYRYLTIDVINIKQNTLLKEMLWYSVFLVPNTLFFWIINSLDRYMILYFYDASLNGIYAVAYRVPVLLTAVSQVFVQSWQLTAMKEFGTSSGVDFTNKIYNKMCVILLTISSGIIVILKLFLKMYVGEEYFIAWQPSSFLLIAAAFTIIASFVGTSYVAAKKNAGNMLSTMVGGLVNFCMNLVLIPIWGLNGAAIATCVAYTIVIGYRLIDTRRFVYIDAINFRIIFTLIINMLQIFILFNTVVYISAWNILLFIIIIFVNREDLKLIIRSLVGTMKGRLNQ